MCSCRYISIRKVIDRAVFLYNPSLFLIPTLQHYAYVHLDALYELLLGRFIKCFTNISQTLVQVVRPGHRSIERFYFCDTFFIAVRLYLLCSLPITPMKVPLYMF